jgi:PAS domain S-box-containing protein
MIPPDEPIAIVVADPGGHIEYWSSGAADLFGYSVSEANGATLDLIVPDDYRERHWAGFRRAVETGQAHLEGARANIPVRCKDGSVVPFPGRFGLVRDGHNRIVGAIGVFSQRVGDEQLWAPPWEWTATPT